MHNFKKKPLKNKNTTMNTIKKYTLILAVPIIVILLFLLIVGQIQKSILKQELLWVTNAYETAIEPSELEKAIIELENNRISRTNDQAEIDELQSQIDVIVDRKKEKMKRADELNDIIIELSGL